MSTTTTRTRWAAIGAAVAVTLGAGGVGISQATTDSGDGPVSAFFPIEPCRLADNAAIGADTSITLDGWGTTGACELPDNITGLAANVTAVNATQQTNLRFSAAGDDVPETANLNPTPGAPPTPNAVNVPLDESNGQFNVYNRFGTVSVFIDVLGYYDDHTHDDRYYTEDEINDALEEFNAGSVGGLTADSLGELVAIIRLTSGSDGYTVIQGTDPGYTITSISNSVFSVGALTSEARSQMTNATCESGFSSLEMFTVYKNANVADARAELHLLQPDGTPLSFTGRAVYCVIWDR